MGRKARQKGAVNTLARHCLMRLPARSVLSRVFFVVLALALGLAAAALVAQMEGERGVPPIAYSGDFEAAGVKVDVYAKDSETARMTGWKLAQRLGWQKLWASTNGGRAPGLSDAQLNNIVSSIEVESEQIGPRRYIATLRVMFDRARTGQILGVSGSGVRSPPLLVIPVLWEGGTATSFESINEWQKAWARYRTNSSTIDYVRVSGSGPDALLLNQGQIGRRGRNWWRNLLDQYGAADVVIPIARITRLWPGGPVEGRFAARYGPDNALIGTFALRVQNEAAIPQMFDQAIERLNGLYSQALLDGRLRPDASLVIDEPINAVAGNAMSNMVEPTVEEAPLLSAEPGTASFAIQFDTPDVASVSRAEALVRGLPGVRSAATSSLALGGTSVMQVSFDGSAEMLRTALTARGYTVTVNGATLRISRRADSSSQGQ